jgi:hypothetical protein
MSNGISDFVLKILGQDAPADPYAGAIKLTAPNQTLKIGEGTSDNQKSKIYAVEKTDLGAGSTDSVDLKTDEDRYGVALNATDVALVWCEHLADSSASSISLQPNGTNGWTSTLKSGSEIELFPGDGVLLRLLTADNSIVDGTTKVLDVVNNDGGNAASYRLQIWTRD